MILDKLLVAGCERYLGPGSKVHRVLGRMAASYPSPVSGYEATTLHVSLAGNGNINISKDRTIWIAKGEFAWVSKGGIVWGRDRKDAIRRLRAELIYDMEHP